MAGEVLKLMYRIPRWYSDVGIAESELQCAKDDLKKASQLSKPECAKGPTA